MVEETEGFELTLAHADTINALLPDCSYVVGIRCNETEEVVFCPQRVKWHDLSGLYWWSSGNMSCDCNRELEFRRAKGEDPDFESVSCSDGRFTIVGIWLPDGSDFRDLSMLNDF